MLRPSIVAVPGDISGACAAAGPTARQGQAV